MRSFDFTRTVSADENDPVTTPPADADIIQPTTKSRVSGSGKVTDGVAFYLEFLAGTAPTATVTTWVRDGAQSSPDVWLQVDQQTVQGDFTLQTVLGLALSDVFLQISALAGSPTSVTVRATSAAAG